MSAEPDATEQHDAEPNAEQEPEVQAPPTQGAMAAARVDLWEGSRIAVYSLRANRMRTVLTTAGIGIGVATLLAILGIIQGLNSSFERQLSQMGSNTLYISRFKWGGGPSEWWESRNRKEITLKQVEAVRQAKYISAAAPFTSMNTEVTRLDTTLPQVMMLGTTEDYISLSGYELNTGRFLTSGDDDAERQVVVLGIDVVQSLFPGTNPLGATILMDGQPYHVVGTLNRRGKMLDANFDRAVIIPYRTLLAKFGRRRPMQVIVGVDKAEHVNKAVDELTGTLRRARQTPPMAPDDFVINKPEQLMGLYNKLTGSLYAVVAGIGLITLLVGGIGIMNIMLVAVRERTREIGVRRALGARKRTIVIQFLIEAAAVSAVGGTLGTAVGLSLAKIVALVSPLAAAVQPLTIVFGIGFAALVGLLFGIWPAARAANLDPVEALRYE